MDDSAYDIIRFESLTCINWNVESGENISRLLQLDLETLVRLWSASLVTLGRLVTEGGSRKVEGRHNVVGLELLNNFQEHSYQTIESARWFTLHIAKLWQGM